jgi:hypothetical protein
MSIALGTLAVMLAGLGGPIPPRVEGPEITYRFEMIEIRGLDWRAALGRGLKPVASRGGVAVWTAPRDFLGTLPEGTVKRGSGVPTLKAYEQAVAHITMRQGQPFVTQASWRGADLPPRATTEQVREGMAATIRGRRLDQGILTTLVIEDTEVHAVHTLALPSPKTAHAGCGTSATTMAHASAIAAACSAPARDEALTRTAFVGVPDQACCAAEAASAAGCAAVRTAQCTLALSESVKCCAEATKCFAQAKLATADSSVHLRIPEIGHGEVAGEWLIPRDEVLLVGFGPHTVADQDGKAVVRERLAVITAEESESAAPQAMTSGILPHALPRIAAPAEVAAPAAVAPARIPSAPGAAMPALPSRSLPQGVNAEGKAVDLPPLPEDSKAEDPADSSSDPRPSPQTRRPRPQTEAGPTDSPAARPSANKDSRASKAAFAFPRALFRPAGLPTIGIPNLQFMLPLKPFELKLPLNQKLELELVGRVVPDTDPAPEKD